MKKLLLGSATLLVFSASIVIFQMSCSKESFANDSNNEGRILYVRQDSEETALWSMKTNGTGDHKININLPAGWSLQNSGFARVTDNKIIFLAYNQDEVRQAFFTCNINGGNVIKIKDGPAFTNMYIEDVYSNDDDD